MLEIKALKEKVKKVEEWGKERIEIRGFKQERGQESGKEDGRMERWKDGRMEGWLINE